MATLSGSYELIRQEETYAAIEGRLRNIKTLLDSTSTNNAIAQNMARLTGDITKITAAYKDASAAADKYIATLQANIETSTQRVSDQANKMIEDIKDTFADVNTDLLKENLANVINAEDVEDATDRLKAYIDGLRTVRDLTAEEYRIKKSERDAEFKTALKSRLTSEDANARRDAIDELNSLNILTTDQADRLKTQNTSQEKLNEAIGVLGVELENINKLRQAERDLIKDSLKERAEELRLSRELNEALRLKAEYETRIVELESLNNKARGDTTKGFQTLADTMFGASTKGNLFSSSLITVISNMKGTKAGFLDLGQAITDGFVKNMIGLEASVNRVANLINDKVIKSTFSMADAFAKLNKETGGTAKGMTGGDMFKSFASPQLAAYGVNLEVYLEAQGKLLNSFTKFNTLGIEQQRILTESAVKMEALGVTADNYGKLATGLYASMGLEAKNLSEVMDKMARDAIGMGISVSKYLNDMQANLSKITGYGREATTIFKELEGIAKAAGDSISAADITNFTDQFNNIDQAAESLSKLNVVLGGTSLNFTDLVELDPAERFIAIKRATEEAGLSFNSLNRGYKDLLAELTGGDRQKAAALFNLPLEKAYEMMNKTSASAKELEQYQKASTTAQEKLSKAIDNMRVAFTPILEAVSTFADWIIKLEQKMGPGGTLALAVGALTGIMAGAWAMFRFAARQAFAEITVQLEHLNVQIAQMGNGLLRTRIAAGSVGGFSGTPTPATGGRFAGRGGAIAGLAGAAIGIGMIAAMSSRTKAEESAAVNSALTQAQPQKVGSADAFGFNPKTGQRMEIDPKKPLFVTPSGEPTQLSENGIVLEGIPGKENLIPTINNNGGSSTVSTSQYMGGSSYSQVGSSANSLSTAQQSAFYQQAGSSFAEHFVKQVSNASTSGDTNVRNMFGGGTAPINVHVSMDGEPIAHKVIKKHGDKLTEGVFNRAGVKV